MRLFKASLWFAGIFMFLCAAMAMLHGCAPVDTSQLSATIADTRQQIAELRARATTMPSDSPDKKIIEANAAKADAALAKAQAALEAAEALKNGDTQAAIKAAGETGIPYAGLAAALLTLALREYQNYQTKKTLKQSTTDLAAAWIAEEPVGVSPALAAHTTIVATTK